MLDFDEAGQPVSRLYRDVYRSRDGALEESRAVFVEGTHAPARWRGRERFTILELGFGLGVNLLATLAAWRADPRRAGRLHFVSVEGHPLDADSLADAHRALGIDGEDARRLRARWPVATPGLHRIEFDGGRATLLLAIGEVEPTLVRLAAGADAIYLDGFAPARNPAMWTPAVMKAVARLARPGATLATYTAAIAVREGLRDAGFEVERVPGHGTKRERIAARYAPRWKTFPPPPDPPAWPRREAVVVGAGLGGCAIAAELGARGWRVRLLERRRAPVAEGSAQPALADHPHLSPDDNPLARLTRAALVLAGEREIRPAGMRTIGRLSIARDRSDEAAQRAALERLGFPQAFVRALDAHEASTIAGVRLDRGALWMPGCRVADPRALAGAWLRDAAVLTGPGGVRDAAAARGEHAPTAPDGAPWSRMGTAVDRIARAGDDWIALDARGDALAHAPVMVLACAGAAPALAGMDPGSLRRVRGQSTTLAGVDAIAALRTVLGGDAYACPLGDRSVLVGATFDDGDSDTPDPAADLGNLRRLARVLGGTGDPHAWASRAAAGVVASHLGARWVARDRLPLIGAIVDEASVRAHALEHARNDRRPLPLRPGLFGAFAFGSRGLLWAELAAAVLGAALDGDPAPIERDLLAAIAPGRFLRHGLRRLRPR